MVSLDVAAVLSAANCGKISLVSGAHTQPLPDWATWFVRLGQWMRWQASMPGRRFTIVRMPTRRLAGAFGTLGAMFAAARLHDDSLDWSALRQLPERTVVHWRDSRFARYSGRIGPMTELGGEPFLSLTVENPKRNRGMIFSLSRATALSYGVTLGSVSQQTDARLDVSGAFFKSVLDGASATWVRSPAVDNTLVTEQSSARDDLSAIFLKSDSTSSAVPFTEVLAFTDSRQSKHGKTLLLSARSELDGEALTGVTILDGVAALGSLSHVRARSVLVLLDYAEHDESAMHDIRQFTGVSIDKGVYSPGQMMPPVPQGIEICAFGMPDHGAGAI